LIPYFLPVGDGFRFCVFYEAQIHPVKGAVLYVPPFAEEMNKSRRMAARQARSLAKAGYCVLQMDLLGCGDSSGVFEDATWDLWLKDVLQACEHLRSRSKAPLTLWGLRAGCLLAAQAAAELSESVNFIFWQPVLSGKQHWQQFMRLKTASELVSGSKKGGADEIRQSLAAGHPVDIAGYSIAPGLVQGLESTELLPPARKCSQVAWIELSSRSDATLSPVAQKRLQVWEEAGFRVHATVATGPAFWQTTEIEDAPELLLKTLDALDSGS